MYRRPPWLTGLAGAVLAAALGSGTLIRLYVDWLWYGEVGYRQVFLTLLFARYASAALWGGLSAAAFYLNLRTAFKAVSPFGPALWPVGRWVRGRALRLLLLLASLLPALPLAALGSSLAWPLLLWAYRVPFGVADPVLGMDASFYVFALPVYRALLRAATLVVLIALVSAGIVYAGAGALYLLAGRPILERPALRHLGLLWSLLLGLKALDYVLDRYELLVSPGGAFAGPGYTDVHVRLPALGLLALAAAAAAAATGWGAYRGRLSWVGMPTAALVACSLLAALSAAAVQRFLVTPNELARERPYLSHHIRFTRIAYGLEGVALRPFDPSPSLSAVQVAAYADVLQNVRLWDPKPLLTLLGQVQSIRPYYVFADVDVDRYPVGGRTRQVMVAARELDTDLLSEAARTWVNVHLKYTHGYGAVAIATSEIGPGGQPVFLLRDIPPRSQVEGLRVTRPEIYYGERTRSYAIVGTREDEFDYPMGETNAVTRYQGKGGIPLGGPLRRLVLSAYLGSFPVLVSGALTPESRLLLHREVRARVERIAPFLVLDSDPYLVIRDDGRLAWILDAYTVARSFPYAEPYRGEYARNPRLYGVNYLRASVKAVVDAYHGTVELYAFDPRDPVLATYRRLFPGLFRPAEAMPPDLQRHVRYPEDGFRVQAEMFARYHVTDPGVFYHREDVWAVPLELYQDAPVPMEPYYVYTRLPGQPQPSFMLFLPFTPQRRENMVGWLAARSDLPGYGELWAYALPKQELVYGPLQVENRINQDPAIARDLALWSQRGVRVLRGNLMVVPLGQSILYVEPLFLEAEQRGLPELKRVVAALGDRVVMAETLEDALAAATGQAPPPASAGEGSSLAAEAARLYREATEALRAGDFTTFGERWRRLGEVLERLEAQSPAGR